MQVIVKFDFFLHGMSQGVETLIASGDSEFYIAKRIRLYPDRYLWLALDSLKIGGVVGGMRLRAAEILTSCLGLCTGTVVQQYSPDPPFGEFAAKGQEPLTKRHTERAAADLIRLRTRFPVSAMPVPCFGPTQRKPGVKTTSPSRKEQLSSWN